MGTKEKPGEFDGHAAAGDDEPVFTLRARDPLASVLVNLWVDLRTFSRPIAHEPDRARERRQRREARTCAHAMRTWKAFHPTP